MNTVEMSERTAPGDFHVEKPVYRLGVLPWWL